MRSLRTDHTRSTARSTTTTKSCHRTPTLATTMIRRPSPGDSGSDDDQREHRGCCTAVAWSGAPTDRHRRSLMRVHPLPRADVRRLLLPDRAIRDSEAQVRRAAPRSRTSKRRTSHASRSRSRPSKSSAKLSRSSTRWKSCKRICKRSCKQSCKHVPVSTSSTATTCWTSLNRAGLRWIPLGDLLEALIDHRGKTPRQARWRLDPGRPSSRVCTRTPRMVSSTRSDHHYISSEVSGRWMRTPLQTGDLLLTSEAPLGAVAHINHDVDWAIGQRLFALRPKADVLNSRFLFHLLAGGPPRSELARPRDRLHRVRKSASLEL